MAFSPRKALNFQQVSVKAPHIQINECDIAQLPSQFALPITHTHTYTSKCHKLKFYSSNARNASIPPPQWVAYRDCDKRVIPKYKYITKNI